MRVILDTNVFISAILHSGSSSARLVQHWLDDRFELLTCDEHIQEFRRVTRYPKIAANVVTPLVGRLVNDLRDKATVIEKLPLIDLSPDPWDNFLLALAEAGRADFLVTGDKAGLLAVGSHAGTSIVTVRDLLDRLS
jgi:putative PIN family toxin of toxin-antitoxin system